MEAVDRLTKLEAEVHRLKSDHPAALRAAEQKIESQATELVRLKKALNEESHKRTVQEEALRSLWKEVQHLQNWAEQVSSQESSSIRSPTYSPMLGQRSPEALADKTNTAGQ